MIFKIYFPVYRINTLPTLFKCAAKMDNSFTKRLKSDKDIKMSSLTSWVKKYELDAADEAAMNEKGISQLLNLIKNGKHAPKIIMVAPKFGGVASTILTLAKMTLLDKFATAFLQLFPNNSEGFTTLFEKLNDFLHTKIKLPKRMFKLVVVHAFDTMSKKEQHSLWQIIQLHSQTTGFILLSSNEASILPKLKREFNLIYFWNKTYFLNKIKDVCAAEKVKFAEKTLLEIVEKAHGNFTHAVAALQDIVDGRSCQNRNENPFENDIVICNILSFFKTKEVKLCRLINSQWNKNSNRILEQLVPPKYNLTFHGISDSKRELLTSLKTSATFPLPRRIRLENAFLNILEEEGKLLSFFNAISPKLMVLAISLHDRNSPVDIGQLKSIIFPNLTNIHIDICWFPNMRRLKESEFLRWIFKNSPNLTGIHLRTNLWPDLPELEPINSVVNILADMQLKQVVKRLTSLTLETQSLLSPQYDLLTSISPKLKVLHACPPMYAGASFNRFLESQSKSLESLRIDLKHHCAQVQLGQFPKLKVLQLPYCSKWNQNQCISYRKQFPLLEHLEFVTVHDEQVFCNFFHLGGNEDDVRHNVKTLIFTNTKLSPENIENAAHLFPNLTKLEIQASLETLKKVYAAMIKLQELTLGYTNYNYQAENSIDNILMGVPEEERKKETNVKFDKSQSLTALTELQTLRIRSSRNIIIREELCRRVFMKMESLNFVEFCKQEFRGVPDLLLEEMRKKFVILYHDVCPEFKF